MTSMIASAVSSGGFYDTWELNDHWSTFNYQGIYDPSVHYTNWTLGTIPPLRAGAQKTKRLLNVMNKLDWYITQAPMARMTSFNTESDTPVTNYENTKFLYGRKVKFSNANDGAVALGVSRGTSEYLMSDSSNQVWFTAFGQPSAVSYGHVDTSGNWVSEGSVSYNTNSDGTYGIPCATGTVVKVDYSNDLYYKIQNRWQTGQYLNIQSQNGKVQSTTLGDSGWWSAQWIICSTADGYVRFINRNTGAYIHTNNNLSYVQYGSLASNSWWSAQWTLIPTDSGYLKINSRGDTSKYIHIQNNLGYAENGTLGSSDWWSAQWTLVPIQ